MSAVDPVLRTTLRHLRSTAKTAAEILRDQLEDAGGREVPAAQLIDYRMSLSAILADLDSALIAAGIVINVTRPGADHGKAG